MNITAQMIKELREKTGLGILECKQALTEAQGNEESAKRILRERCGDISVTSLPTLNGIVDAMASQRANGKPVYSIVKVGTETDFAANSELTRKLVKSIVAGNILGTDLAPDTLAVLRSTLKENVQLLMNYTSGEEIADVSRIGLYVHHDYKTAAVVLFKGEVDKVVANQVAMHLAAVDPEPMAISAENFDLNKELYEGVIEKEREFLTKKAQTSGKPPEIQAKIIDGGLKRFKEARAILTQPFVMDPKKTVKEIIGQAQIVKIHKVVVGK